MEEAAGGSGARPATTIALSVLALILACACAFGGVLVAAEHRSRARAAAEQERYGDVLAAAGREVEAFVNIDYRHARDSIDAVAAGATGDFARQYGARSREVQAAMRRNRSVMDGTVLWAGVVDVDADSATVIAATRGTVSNVRTGEKPVARDFRVTLELQRVDGRWLTSRLDLVGA